MIITTPHPALSEELQAAFHRIIDYLWVDEERSCEAEPDAQHIFHSLALVRAWLSQMGEPPAKFELGALFITVGAHKEIALEDVTIAIARHSRGDWGQVDEEDRQSNEHALREGLRLISVYPTRRSGILWVITEADRSATMVLLPCEY